MSSVGLGRLGPDGLFTLMPADIMYSHDCSTNYLSYGRPTRTTPGSEKTIVKPHPYRLLFSVVECFVARSVFVTDVRNVFIKSVS